MKRCPSCNRTYSDETISFCLADGALLSPSYDPSREQGPPTEIMPPQTRPAVPPTQSSNTVMPTIASLPVAHDFSPRTVAGTRPMRKSYSLFWIASALIGVAVVAGMVFVLRYSLSSRSESVTESKSQETPTGVNNYPSASASVSPNSSAITRPTETVPSTRSSPPENKRPDPLEPNAATQVATPTASPSVDYSRIFSGRDVDQKVQVLSKPDPVYTEEARRNQVDGTVVLRAVFSASGEVTNIHAVSGLSDGLTERAIGAAKQIKFVPARKDGHPVSMWMELQYHFNLY
jgi:TonB family protein